MIKHTILAAFIVTSSALALSQQDMSDPSSQVGTRFANGIAAIAESKIITVEDVRREIQPYLPQIQQDAQGNPARFRQLLESAEDQIIQNLTDNVLIVKKFYEDKGQIPPSFVKNEVNERMITMFNNDRAEFLAYLKSIGKTPEEYEEMIKEEIIVNFMRSKMRKTAAFVSPVKIENFYEKNKQEFYNEESVHLRLIKLSQVADEDADLLQQTAREIIRQLDQGASFEELAKKHSQDSRRRRGGDWGWINRKSLVGKLADAAFALEPGQHSEPIEVKGNIYILYVEDRRDSGYTPLEDVRDVIEDALVSQMAQEAQDRWLERLRRDGYVRRFN